MYTPSLYLTLTFSPGKIGTPKPNKQTSKMRRASVEHIEKLYQSKADQARERRVSLTIMNCIWARNTERETTHPVHGEVVGKLLDYMFVFLYS